ncbi:MAG: hypothetical protein R2697_07580 [Ilumatobacteraceae bacterium]
MAHARQRDTGRVAPLFIDPNRPWRMRLQGTARVSIEAADVGRHVGAQAVLIVGVERAFPNWRLLRPPRRRDLEVRTLARPHKPPIPSTGSDRTRPVLPERDQAAFERLDPTTDGWDGSQSTVE